MQRLLLHKLGSKFLRDCCANPPSLQSICSKTYPSNLQNLPPISSPCHFFSHSTVSSRSWRFQKGVAEKIHGFFSNPVLLKQVLPNALLKGTGNIHANCGVGFLRAQISRRGFQLNREYEPRRGSWRSWLQRQKADNVVLALILTNVAVFMLWRIADRQFMIKNFAISVENFRSWRLHTMITCAFSHVEIGHLISNMIGLYFFGMHIGRMLGPEFLLKLYFSGAVVGSVFFLVHQAFLSQSSKNGQTWSIPPSRVPGWGASGAVNAIMLLNIFLFPKSTLYLEFIIPVPAALLGIFLIGKDMLRILEGDSHISGAAHLGGAVVAAIAWARVRRGRF